jgi:internalin A
MRKRLLLIAACQLLAAGPVYADDAEDAAAKAIEKLGGAVTRDDADAAHPVVAVILAASPTTDAQLKALAALKAVRTLDLTVCLGVSDEGMKHVAGLKGLETLNLGYTGVTDAGLKRLAGLSGLRTLNLAGDRITDERLKELAALKQLRTLVLVRTQVTDDGVAALQKALPNCKISR